MLQLNRDWMAFAVLFALYCLFAVAKGTNTTNTKTALSTTPTRKTYDPNQFVVFVPTKPDNSAATTAVSSFYLSS